MGEKLQFSSTWLVRSVGRSFYVLWTFRVHVRSEGKKVGGGTINLPLEHDPTTDEPADEPSITSSWNVISFRHPQSINNSYAPFGSAISNAIFPFSNITFAYRECSLRLFKLLFCPWPSFLKPTYLFPSCEIRVTFWSKNGAKQKINDEEMGNAKNDD